MTEHFEIMKNDRTFCFCELCLRDESERDEANHFAKTLISNVRAGIEDYVAALTPTDEENEKISRWSIVPFRYRLSVYCNRLCDDLVFIECTSSFDARFPGGRHLMTKKGLIFDVNLNRCLKPSFALPFNISKKEQRKLGAPTELSYDGASVKLDCTMGECSADVDSFCKRYKTFSDLRLNFDKKTIDKHENI